MDFIIGFAIGFIVGGISIAVWLKVTDRLVAKVKDKAGEYGDKYL